MTDLEGNILVLKDIVSGLENGFAGSNADDLDIPSPIPEKDAPDESSSQKEAYVLALMGVHGGVGVTSLAVQLASDLAEEGKRNKLPAKVLLIDLDFERGCVAPYLDIGPSACITDLNAAAGRMDTALAQTFIRQTQGGIHVFAAKPELGGNDKISGSALLGLLDAAASMFDTIILDIPSFYRPTTQAVLRAADKLVLLCEARVPALHQCKSLAENLVDDLDINMPDIVISKYERRSLRGGINLQDAANVLERTDLSEICVDEDTLRQAINVGQPASAVKPDSRYVKSVRNWSGGLFQDLSFFVKPETTRGFWSGGDRRQRRQNSHKKRQKKRA